MTVKINAQEWTVQSQHVLIRPGETSSGYVLVTHLATDYDPSTQRHRLRKVVSRATTYDEFIHGLPEWSLDQWNLARHIDPKITIEQRALFQPTAATA